MNLKLFFVSSKLVSFSNFVFEFRRIDFPREVVKSETLLTNFIIDETTSRPENNCDDVYVYMSDTIKPGKIWIYHFRSISIANKRKIKFIAQYNSEYNSERKKRAIMCSACAMYRSVKSSSCVKHLMIWRIESEKNSLNRCIVFTYQM